MTGFMSVMAVCISCYEIFQLVAFLRYCSAVPYSIGALLPQPLGEYTSGFEYVGETFGPFTVS